MSKVMEWTLWNCGLEEQAVILKKWKGLLDLILFQDKEQEGRRLIQSSISFDDTPLVGGSKLNYWQLNSPHFTFTLFEAMEEEREGESETPL